MVLLNSEGLFPPKNETKPIALDWGIMEYGIHNLYSSVLIKGLFKLYIASPFGLGSASCHTYVTILGFSGKGAIHPKQIKILNDVFTPTHEEVTKAKSIVDIFNKSSTGLVVFEGKLIEKPVLRDMLRIINIYNKINSL